MAITTRIIKPEPSAAHDTDGHAIRAHTDAHVKRVPHVGISVSCTD